MPPQCQRQRNVDGDQAVPFAKIIEEDWDGDHQKKFSRIFQTLRHEMHSNHHNRKNSLQVPNPQQAQQSQIQCYQCPQTQNLQCPWSQPFDVPDRYSEQIRLHREWEEKMERHNEKYGLDSLSDSELDSKSDEGEDYRYEHKYETLI